MSGALVKGSIVSLLDAIQTLNTMAANAAGQALGIPAPAVYRVRPRSNIEPPAIYPWIGNSPFEVMDLSRGRDTVTVLNRIAVRYVDVDEETDTLLGIHDAYVKAVDTSLWTPRLDPSQTTLGQVAHAAQRTGARMTEDSFNDIAYLCMENTITVQLDRAIR